MLGESVHFSIASNHLTFAETLPESILHVKTSFTQ